MSKSGFQLSVENDEEIALVLVLRHFIETALYHKIATISRTDYVVDSPSSSHVRAGFSFSFFHRSESNFTLVNIFFKNTRLLESSTLRVFHVSFVHLIYAQDGTCLRKSQNPVQS